MAKRILVVERDEYVLNCIQLMLNTEGYGVLGDTSVASIGEQILDFSPHLILLDLISIGGQNSSALRSIRLNPQSNSIPVLFISCTSGLKASPDLVDEDILLKPLDLNALIDRVKEVLGD